MTQLTDQWMIMVAGSMRSGKSTLARRIVERFGGVRVGFGDAVRRRAQELGLPRERRLLQQIGEEWVACDPEGLCDAVLASSAGQAMVVVDGVRHQHIHGMLRERAQGRRVILIFVDTGIGVRRDRLAVDGVKGEAIDTLLNHSTENELPLLREVADIVADGTRDAAQVLAALEGLIAGGLKEWHIRHRSVAQHHPAPPVLLLNRDGVCRDDLQHIYEGGVPGGGSVSPERRVGGRDARTVLVGELS